MPRCLGLFMLFFVNTFSFLLAAKGALAYDLKKVKAFGLELLWEKELEDVSFYARAGHPADACLRFSKNGKMLALGTFTGRLMLFSAESGRLIWEKRVPEGMVKRVAFSEDGRVLYYGAQSPDAEVCALETKTGKRLWCFNTAKSLERGTPAAPGDIYGVYQLPGIYRLKVLRNGDLLVLGLHSWYDEEKSTWRRLSRLWRLSPAGQVRWAYPKDGPAPVTMIYADADHKGQVVATVTLMPSEYEGDRQKPGPPPQSFVALSGRSGKEIFIYQLTPLKPYFKRVSAWESVAVSPDGHFGALGASDGRLFIFDLKAKRLLHTLNLATPIVIGGFPVAASLSYGTFGANGIFYVVSGESTLPYGLPMAGDKPAGPHPKARMLFAVEPASAKVLWQFPSPFKLQGVAVDPQGKTLAVAAAAFRREDVRVRQFGVLVFDLTRPGGGLTRFAGYFPTLGPCFFHLAVSPDSRLIAVVENPWQDEMGKMFGSYRLLVLKR
ncbi:WD40 repeat domain-containing protein [Thermodesulfatator atlanticus]|uniref:WD40 repeat domain-containing protein n=1 Tax=Thermodesulfatator atlanticus TaxID=501497 RepID=UPI0012F82021|nr:PQQ-binding-like beta-propeller repeat protein [Thermodesulfatator atlanticus]